MDDVFPAIEEDEERVVLLVGVGTALALYAAEYAVALRFLDPQLNVRIRLIFNKEIYDLQRAKDFSSCKGIMQRLFFTRAQITVGEMFRKAHAAVSKQDGNLSWVHAVWRLFQPHPTEQEFRSIMTHLVESEFQAIMDSEFRSIKNASLVYGDLV
jgi:hypothetical protein